MVPLVSKHNVMVESLIAGLGRTAHKLEKSLHHTARRMLRQIRLKSYLRSDRRPWRFGYEDYRMLSLEKAVHNAALLNNFRNGKPLPQGYGYRLDARIVEIPWLISRLSQQPGAFLDAGSSLNHEFVLKTPQIARRKVTILTLGPERVCFWFLGVAYLFGDLRETLFRDHSFDEIACISTIEHIGMDNSMYAGQAEAANKGSPRDFLMAVKELQRVLKPGGTLYITFPFGQYEDHGWFQQFDAALADALIDRFSPSVCHEVVLLYDQSGWQLSDRAGCADAQFFDVRSSKHCDPSSTIEYPTDYPAGERAVMCLELQK